MAITKNRINNVDISRCVVYRMSRDELGSGGAVLDIVNSNGANTAYLRFNVNATGNAVWTAFIDWWKKNPNAILLGCMVWNNGSAASQNKGFYWCPVNRTGTWRSDSYTNLLEFTIQRGDDGIFDPGESTGGAVTYQFYFINLTH